MRRIRIILVAIVIASSFGPLEGRAQALNSTQTPQLQSDLFSDSAPRALNDNVHSFISQHRELLAQYTSDTDAVQLLANTQKDMRIERQGYLQQLRDARLLYSQPAGSGETKRRQADSIRTILANLSVISQDYARTSSELATALRQQKQTLERMSTIATQLHDASLAALGHQQ